MFSTVGDTRDVSYFNALKAFWQTTLRFIHHMPLMQIRTWISTLWITQCIHLEYIAKYLNLQISVNWQGLLETFTTFYLLTSSSNAQMDHYGYVQKMQLVTGMIEEPHFSGMIIRWFVNNTGWHVRFWKISCLNHVPSPARVSDVQDMWLQPDLSE